MAYVALNPNGLYAIFENEPTLGVSCEDAFDYRTEPFWAENTVDILFGNNILNRGIQISHKSGVELFGEMSWRDKPIYIE